MTFLLQPSESVRRARQLLKPVAQEWQKTVHEPVPQDMLDRLAKLP